MAMPLVFASVFRLRTGSIRLAAAIVWVCIAPAAMSAGAGDGADGSAASGNLVGHGGPVKAVRISPDGETALTGSFDYSMIHWRLASPDGITPQDTVLRRFDAHEGAVNAVAFLPDGQHAVAAGDDGMVTLWALASGKALHRFSGHTGKVMAIDVSADGRWAVTASWDRTLRLWDLENRVAGPILTGHKGPVNAAVFADNGSKLYSASYDGTIGQWNLATGKLERTIYRHGWGVNVLKALPGGKQLVFGALNGTVGILDLATGTLTHEMKAHERPVLSLAVLAKPGLIASGSGDGIVRVYRIGDWKLLEEHQNPYGPVWAMDFAKSGTELYYGGLDDFVTRWQISPRKPFEPTDSKFPRRFQVSSEVSLGERQFARKCSICHTLEKNGRNRAGPTLFKVFGRKIGSVPGYPYSEALASGAIVWSTDTMRKLFTLGPERYTPGTKMPLQKIKDPKKIEALIAYLKMATDDKSKVDTTGQ